MVANENRRRKKIEAQRAKRKDKQRTIARVESSGKVVRMTVASHWPLFESRISTGLDERGIANALISRRNPNGQVAGAIFLVDAYCLGVKDVAVFIGSETSWKRHIAEQQERGMQLVDISPEALRKLVDGAVDYASSLGIAPHRDWFHACPILGDIDASQCLTEFTYGHNGKPHFFSGPYDRPARIQQITNLLTNHVGVGNFHITIQHSEDDLGSDLMESSDDEPAIAEMELD